MANRWSPVGVVFVLLIGACRGETLSTETSGTASSGTSTASAADDTSPATPVLTGQAAPNPVDVDGPDRFVALLRDGSIVTQVIGQASVVVVGPGEPPVGEAFIEEAEDGFIVDRGDGKIVLVSRSGESSVITDGAGPRLSPDGRRLAYLSRSQGPYPCLFGALTVRELESGVERTWRVSATSEVRFDRCPGRPSWDAGSRLLAYELSWESVTIPYVLDSSQPGELLREPAQAVPVPAGRVWKVVGWRGAGGEDLVVLDRSGTTPIESQPVPTPMIAVDRAGAVVDPAFEPGEPTAIGFDVEDNAVLIWGRNGSLRRSLNGEVTLLAAEGVAAASW